MKILITTPIIHPENHPLCSYLDVLTTELSKEHIVKTVAFGKSLLDSRSKDLTVVSKKKNLFTRSLSFLLEIYKERDEVDFIFCQYALVAALPPLLISKLFKIPLIINFPSDEVYERFLNQTRSYTNIENFHSKQVKTIYHKLLIFIQKLVLKSCDRVVVPNIFMKTILTTYYHITSSKIFVVSPFMEKDVVLPFQAKKDEFSFLIYSSLHKEAILKMKPIIEAFQALKTKFPQLRLHIFGDGGGRQDLQREVEKSGLEEFVYLHGRASHAETYFYKQKCRFFISINPSARNIHHLLENAKLETISVLMDNDISREHVRHKENGVIFTNSNLEEILTELLSSNSLRNEILTTSGQELKTKYSVQNHVKRLIKVYES
jgi:glycosyltransferase involved in cell wall biosynthesis